MSLYKAGKNHGSTSYDMGKKANSLGVKVSNSAGKNSGTDCKGDSKGAPAMGKGK